MFVILVNEVTMKLYVPSQASIPNKKSSISIWTLICYLEIQSCFDGNIFKLYQLIKLQIFLILDVRKYVSTTFQFNKVNTDRSIVKQFLIMLHSSSKLILISFQFYFNNLFCKKFEAPKRTSNSK